MNILIETDGLSKYYSKGKAIKAVDGLDLDVEKGEVVTVQGVELLDRETKPPARFSQGKLIQEMDRIGLGTKSTRHTIIQKLYARNYITGSPMQPTATGRAVISALENHARTITEPDMTSSRRT